MEAAAADGSGTGSGSVATVASAVTLPLAGAVIGGTVLGPAGALLGTSFARHSRRGPWRGDAHARVPVGVPLGAGAQASRARGGLRAWSRSAWGRARARALR